MGIYYSIYVYFRTYHKKFIFINTFVTICIEHIEGDSKTGLWFYKKKKKEVKRK